MILYPNPFTKGDLMIETGFESELKVSIFDIQGKMVYKKHFQGPNFKFKGLELESGLYFVSLGTNKGDKRIKQLVVLE